MGMCVHFPECLQGLSEALDYLVESIHATRTKAKTQAPIPGISTTTSSSGPESNTTRPASAAVPASKGHASALPSRLGQAAGGGALGKAGADEETRPPGAPSIDELLTR